jgi:hypothetical protein
MYIPANEVKKYVDKLKSECAELETCLQADTNIKELCIASKRVVFAAAELDEMILRLRPVARNAPPLAEIA